MRVAVTGGRRRLPLDDQGLGRVDHAADRGGVLDSASSDLRGVDDADCIIHPVIRFEPLLRRYIRLGGNSRRAS